MGPFAVSLDLCYNFYQILSDDTFHGVGAFTSIWRGGALYNRGYWGVLCISNVIFVFVDIGQMDLFPAFPQFCSKRLQWLMLAV